MYEENIFLLELICCEHPESMIHLSLLPTGLSVTDRTSHCFLSSSYKSFREATIYEGKSTIKVNKVKEHLLNKDKIDTQLTGESHHNDSGKFIIQGRRVIMKVPRLTQNTRI